MSERISILGLGLMGASLGLALKNAGGREVVGYARREATRAAAMDDGVLDEVFDSPVAAVEGADLVVLGVPIRSMRGLLESCRSGLKPGALVTDVGSTKALLVEELPSVLEDSSARYIGSHPICGSEQRGLEAARGDLYERAVTVVTPRPADPQDEVERVVACWEAVGSSVHLMMAEEHDRMLARTSHLPHLVAAALVATVAREGDPMGTGLFCGSGFRDTTRIAEGSPEVWEDVVATNRGALAEELEALHHETGRLMQLVNEGDSKALRDYLQENHALRRALLGQSPEGDE